MAKSSRALAASFMISRSESEPITIETRGLSGMKWYSSTPGKPGRLRSLFQSPRADVAAIVHVFKTDAANRLIGFVERVFQFGRARGNAQHAASVGVDAAVAADGAGVEDLYVLHAGGPIQASDFSCRDKAARIPAGR